MSANIAMVGQSLPSAFSSSVTTPMSWQEAMRLGRGGAICGEIRSEADLASVPRNVKLRAVYVPDGSIRWANSSTMKRVFAKANHDYLVCSGDAHFPTRQGYIIVNSHGQLSVAR